MLERARATEAIATATGRAPVVVLTGPRQCGKTTLARQFVEPDSVNYFDLESPPSLARLEEPMTALAPLRGLVVIDEVQLRPDLFSTLRVLVDRPGLPARYLILGSATGRLLRQTAESLAGRTERVVLGGFTVRETDGTVPDAERTLWRRGGLPRSLLAETEADSVAWRREYVQTLLERDFPQWGVRAPATAMGRFWAMVAHYHGQTWNAADPARALGVSPGVVRRYLDALTDALMVRQLPPWFANVKKRQVKAPKIYLRDSGSAASTARNRHGSCVAQPSADRRVVGGFSPSSRCWQPSPMTKHSSGRRTRERRSTSSCAGEPTCTASSASSPTRLA